MGASDNLRGDQFHTQFVGKLETGASRPTYGIEAYKGGDRVGFMHWNSRGIHRIDVEPEHARQGIATQMWEQGHILAENNAKIPKPKHSAVRTTQGDAWAKSVGGPLPRRKH
jgi:hypothetical protein